MMRRTSSPRRTAKTYTGGSFATTQSERAARRAAILKRFGTGALLAFDQRGEQGFNEYMRDAMVRRQSTVTK